MTARLAIVAFCISTVLAAAPSRAQPVGPRFEVNQLRAGSQGGSMSCAYYKWRRQDVASDAAGNFVVVWQDGDYYGGIKARRYDRFGIPQDGEFQVSEDTSAYVGNRTPSVAMDSAGEFVVAWTHYAPGNSDGDVFARRFGANGAAQGPQFQVSDNGYQYGGYTITRYSYVWNPEVDKDPAGNFIVVWQRSTSDTDLLGDADDQQIMARRYNTAGVAQGPRFKVSDGSNQGFYLNSQPDVATHADGSFVVAWKALVNPGGGQATLGRRFNAAGAPLAGEFGVSSTADFFEATPDVEADGSGGFVVVWGSSSIDEGDYPDMDVAMRRFDASGAPVAAEFRVNTTTAGYQCGPSVARLDNGNFVVTWHRPNYESEERNGYGQVLSAVGSPVGTEFPLDTVGGIANGTAVAAQQNDFVVVWSDGNYGAPPDAPDVYGQRFGTTEAPSCSPAPLAGCRQPTRSAGVFRFNEKSNPARSRLTWVWSRGEATSHDDFGDPFDTSSYAFCLYDGSAAPQPLMTLVAPRGNFCGRIECWRQLGGAQGTIQWVNNAGNFYGLTQIRLKPGSEGAAKITVTARGANLPLPPTPLTAPVVFQAQATNGECWSAHYDAPSRNEPGVFKANPTVP